MFLFLVQQHKDNVAKISLAATGVVVLMVVNQIKMGRNSQDNFPPIVNLMVLALTDSSSTASDLMVVSLMEFAPMASSWTASALTVFHLAENTRAERSSMVFGQMVRDSTEIDPMAIKDSVHVPTVDDHLVGETEQKVVKAHLDLATKLTSSDQERDSTKIDQMAIKDSAGVAPMVSSLTGLASETAMLMVSCSNRAVKEDLSVRREG